MPYGWVEPDIFLEHGGVTIYHVYKDDEIDNVIREYWYTWREDGGELTPWRFDVRDIATALGMSVSDFDEIEEVIKKAIDLGLLTKDGPLGFPEDDECCPQCESEYVYYDRARFNHEFDVDDDGAYVVLKCSKCGFKRVFRPEIGEVSV
ncbi:MAG: hypothetical protein AB1330_01805 [Bacillota bacterium]